MQKFFIVNILILLSLGGLTQSVFNFGVRGGYNSSKVTTNVKDIVTNTFQGYQMGLFFRLGKTNHIQPEVFVSSRGGELDIHYNEDLTLTKKITLNTVEIPLLFGHSLVNTKNFNLRVQGGPAVAFIVDKEIHLSGELDEEIQYDIENELLDELWGLKLGAGMDIFFFTLDVRYDIGLNNFYNQQIKSNIDINSYHNNVFQVSLGVKLISI